MEHERQMARCLELARQALASREAPVGAVVTRGEQIVGEGSESTRAALDHCAHAEIRAIQAACQALRSSDLTGLTLYSTVEPCVLCAYAIRRAGLSRVVFGIPASQAGGYTSQYALLKDASLLGWPPLPEVISGVLAVECHDLMRLFSRRKAGDCKQPHQAR
jgi:tRNA(adenine34) deaminase